ncbi:MAG: hypothetical protein Q8O42_15140 [Acidobacteriota bacterium]|nr:hypothetical protein [Acidobacteriota bacterium]
MVVGAVVIVPDVHVRDTGTVAVLFGTKSFLTVIVAGALHPAKDMVSLVIVRFLVAKSRPPEVPTPVAVRSRPERRVPRKAPRVTVASWEVLQNTLHASPPPLICTVKSVAARSAAPPVPILKIQTSLAFPLSVKRPVSAAPAVKQWTPGPSVTPARVPTWVVVHAWPSIAPFAALRSVTI